jgi:hypothetical protein
MPFRHNSEETAYCGFLANLTGVKDLRLCQVNRSVCEKCVQQFLPGPGQLNSTLAQPLYHLTRKAIDREGIPGLDEERALELKQFAKDNLPLYTGLIHPPRTNTGSCFFLGSQIREDQCKTCVRGVRTKIYRCHHEQIPEAHPRKCQTCPQFEPQLQQTGITRWSVGITTAPRAETTLEHTISSLNAAGWPDTRIFAEPDSPLPTFATSNHQIISRQTRLGAWPNFLLALQELTLRDPTADAYLICQDDVVFAKNLRPYLETRLWPSERLGVVSLYCSQLYSRGDVIGFHQDYQQSERQYFGALAYVFPNAAARSLLRSPFAVDHRFRNPKTGTCLVDQVVSKWARQNALPFYFHTPGLTQHIGDTSTIHGDIANDNHRTSPDFVGEDYDAMALIPRLTPELAQKAPPRSDVPGATPVVISQSKQQETIPAVTDTALICSYFNPNHFASRRTNYERFRENMARFKVPLITTELAFDQDAFELPASDDTLQVRSNSVMWQKERLLNLAIEQVAARGFEKVLWLDADILTADNQWVAKASRTLNDSLICQLFDSIELETAPDGSARTTKSAIGHNPRKQKLRFDNYCPGGAWGARVSLMRKFPLFDSCIVGGGDTAFLIGCYASSRDPRWQENADRAPFLRNLSPAHRDAYHAWAREFGGLIRGQIGLVKSQIRALYHGNHQNRQYGSRHELMNQLDPAADLRLNNDGCWEWNSDRPELHQAVRSYLQNRREDD